MRTVLCRRLPNERGYPDKESATRSERQRFKLEKCLRVLMQDVEHLDEKDPRVMKLIEDIRVMIDALEY